MDKLLIAVLGVIVFFGIGVLFLFWPDKVQQFYDRYDKKGWRISNFELRLVGVLAICFVFIILFGIIRSFW